MRVASRGVHGVWLSLALVLALTFALTLTLWALAGPSERATVQPRAHAHTAAAAAVVQQRVWWLPSDSVRVPVRCRALPDVSLPYDTRAAEFNEAWRSLYERASPADASDATSADDAWSGRSRVRTDLPPRYDALHGRGASQIERTRALREYTRVAFERTLARVAARRTVSYSEETYVHDVFDSALKPFMRDARVLVFGGGPVPLMEAFAVHYGAASVVSVCEDCPRGTLDAFGVHMRSLDEVFASGERFAVALSFSRVEHAGLGRFLDGARTEVGTRIVRPAPDADTGAGDDAAGSADADPLDADAAAAASGSAAAQPPQMPTLCADADLAAMGHAWQLLEPNGVLLLGVPVGDDMLVWNRGRVYGLARLPVLLRGWSVLDTLVDPTTLYMSHPLNVARHGLFVLRKGAAPLDDERAEVCRVPGLCKQPRLPW